MKRVLILGSGKRVREGALPVLHRLPSEFSVASVWARSAKSIEVEGRSYEVRALEGLTTQDLAGIDLVYTAVGKDAVPQVLERLTAHDVSGLELLIDTPVLRFRHFRHVRLLDAFRRVSVAEDCSELPWFDTVEAYARQKDLGSLRSIELVHSGYAYHALATAKRLFAQTKIKSARRKRDGERTRREVVFTNGGTLTVHEPRDYAIGHIELHFEHGALSDDDSVQGQTIEAVLEQERCVGFRIGDVETELSPEEVELAFENAHPERLTGRMDALKRVGFYRLFRHIHAGKGAWPLEEGLDDMVVDYHLEKFGRYLANPFTSSRTSFGRFVLRQLTRRG